MTTPPYRVIVEITDGVEKGERWFMFPMPMWMGSDDDKPPNWPPDYSDLDPDDVVVMALEEALRHANNQRDRNRKVTA